VYETAFRLLACDFTVRSDCEPVARQLNFIAQNARQDFPVSGSFFYEVRSQNGEFLIVENGEPCVAVSDLSSLTYKLLWKIHSQAFDAIVSCVRIHAGCGEHNGNRFLIVGHSGAGKTTLMTRLLYDGFRVDGDEMVMLRNGKTFPFPRCFHIKECSLHLLPQIGPVLENAPFIERDNKSKVFSFSPSEAGFCWHIEKREAKIFFFLQPNHGGGTRIEECPKYLMVQRVMPQTFLSSSLDHPKIKELCQTIDSAACFVLYVGDLDSAVVAIRETLNTA
jgi:hypothetical protein